MVNRRAIDKQFSPTGVLDKEMHDALNDLDRLANRNAPEGHIFTPVVVFVDNQTGELAAALPPVADTQISSRDRIDLLTHIGHTLHDQRNWSGEVHYGEPEWRAKPRQETDRGSEAVR